MRIQIKDLSSGDVYDIGPNGATMGRESARTDIAIPDEAISKKHARLLLVDEQWYLEDLNSSNGTFIDGGRIEDQTPIYKDSTFSLSQRHFEVVEISGNDSYAATPRKPEFYGPESDMASHLSEQGDEDISLPINEGSEPQLAPPVWNQFLAGLAKSLAYYFKVLPLMMVHPVGFVRRGIDEQPWPAMKNLVLLGYTLPAFIACSLTTTLATAIANMIVGQSGGSVLTDGIIMGALIGVVLALAFAFLWHPIVGALIRGFGGTSNAHSRTNYALMYFAGNIFLAIAVSSAPIFNTLALPFAACFSPFLLVLGTITMAYLIHSWNKFFNIANWARGIILALIILSVIGATFNFGTAVHASVMSFYGQSPTTNKQLATPPATNQDIKTRTATAQINEPTNANSTKTPVVTAKASSKGPIGTAANTKAIAKSPQTQTEQANYAQQQQAQTTTVEGPTPFVTFLNKRNAIEEAIKNNPALIRERAIVRDYSRIWKLTYDLREKYRKKKGRRWERDRIFSRQKDADIYDATHKIVDRLYERIMKR